MNMIKEWSVAYVNKKIETNLGEITKALKVEAYKLAMKNPFKAKFNKKLQKMNFYRRYRMEKGLDDFKKQHSNVIVNIKGKFLFA